MPRIYYRNNKIYGKPFKNEIITSELFDKIIQKGSFIPQDSLLIFELPQKSSILPWKKNDKSFKYAVIWNNEQSHTTNEYGTFFMPKAIVFFDEKDAYFPSDYYFIVNIDNQLEISYCRAGAGTAWFQQSDLRKEVTETKLIKRFQKSVLELYEVLETQERSKQ